MGDSKERAQAILSRMRDAYGVKTNVEFSELHGIPQPTISNWISRGNIPLKYVMECSQNTGKNLDWLLNGGFANLNRDEALSVNSDGRIVYEEVLSSGGKQLLQRLLEAYGFSMQKELGDLLGLSSGTISTWIRRDYFPGDVVVACALSTGVSLRWLATGAGSKFDGVSTPTSSSNLLPGYILQAGNLIDSNDIEFDRSLIPVEVENPIVITGISHSWVVDYGKGQISNGLLLLEIDGAIDVYKVVRIPGGRIQLSLYSSSDVFQCDVEDVKCLGHVSLTINRHI